MINKKYTVKFKRKSKTNYKKRMKLLSSKKTRLVIRKTNTNMMIQFINFDLKGDKALVGANSYELKKLGYKNNRGNIPAAYLTGLLAGKKAKNKNIKEAILDLGYQKKGGRLYAALKGVLDVGINIPHSDKIIPTQERLEGGHIKNHNKKFSPENFKDIKEKLMKE